jgi:enoyl-CoA hydratase/carnithine racemase
VTHSVESFLAEHRAATDPVWLRPVINFSKPLIGAVNGFAVGAGCALAMACDILIASSNADFRFPQSSLGIMPIYGGAARLAQWIGRGLAMEILLTGRALSAHEASLHGLARDRSAAIDVRRGHVSLPGIDSDQGVAGAARCLAGGQKGRVSGAG